MNDAQITAQPVSDADAALSSLPDRLAALRARQAIDPVNAALVESLLRKSAQQRAPVAEKLRQAAQRRLARAEQHAPTASAKPTVDARERTQLGALLRELAQRQARRNAPAVPDTFEGLLRMQEVEALQQVEDDIAVQALDELLPAGELQALQQFREQWAQRSTERAVAKAFAEAPEDAGPLNAHRLVVRALTTMQETSPEFLGRFVNYMETLLWLEQAGARLLAKDDKKTEPKRRR